MTSSTRWLSIRLSLLLLLLGAAGLMSMPGCARKESPKAEWPLGFKLEIPATYKLSGGLRPNGEGTVYFLCGDAPDLPRLTVRKRAHKLELVDHLAEELILGNSPVILEEGEVFDVKALNAEGLGQRVVVQPIPKVDSTLTLLFDIRVFSHGNDVWTFVWQQLPEDSVGLKQYEERLTKLEFLIPPAASDSLDQTESRP